MYTPNLSLLLPRDRIWLWQAILIDDDPGSRFERRYESPRNTNAVFVGLIMEEPPEEVYISIFDWLFGEEVVDH